jgi:HK97 family phage prohead protease
MTNLLQPDLAQRAQASELVRRSFTIEEFEFRDDSDTGGWTFEGVASIVDFPYPVRDKFGTYNETIQAGAFDRTLNDPKAHVSLFVNHQRDSIALSSRDAGMQITANPHLRVRAALNPKRPDVQNVRYAIEDRVLTEMSIGFTPVKARDKWNADYTEVVRTQVALREVSIVDRGANIGGTEANMRAFADFIDSLVDVDMDEADVRRAIAYFESRLAGDTVAEPEPENPFAEQVRQLLDRNAKRQYERLSFVA